jgi:hypothetical protein
MARIWAVRIAGVALFLGILLYGFLAYNVISAGLGNAGVERLSCSEAATGRADPLYRINEQLELQRFYLPPSVLCHYSGGERVALIRAGGIGWTGPIVIMVSGLTLVVFAVTGRRRP